MASSLLCAVLLLMRCTVVVLARLPNPTGGFTEFALSKRAVDPKLVRRAATFVTRLCVWLIGKPRRPCPAPSP